MKLGDETRVSIPPTALEGIADLTDEQTGHVLTELVKIAEADYTPTALVYKQYGDLKVFRCGDEMRLFGVIIENLGPYAEFDHLVVLLAVSEHEYKHAGVSKAQARRLQERFTEISSRGEFEQRVSGKLFTAEELRNL